MPKPELSRLSPPMKWTGALTEHRQADVVDHLALVVLVDRHRPRPACRVGDDSARERERVTGRTNPTAHALGSQLADRGLDVPAGVPKATTTTSASSVPSTSASGSTRLRHLAPWPRRTRA